MHGKLKAEDSRLIVSMLAHKASLCREIIYEKRKLKYKKVKVYNSNE